MSQGLSPAGHRVLPAAVLRARPASLLDHILPGDAAGDRPRGRAPRGRALLGRGDSERYEQGRHDVEHPLLPSRGELFLAGRRRVRRDEGASPSVRGRARRSSRPRAGHRRVRDAPGRRALPDRRAGRGASAGAAASGSSTDFDGRVLIVAETAGPPRDPARDPARQRTSAHAAAEGWHAFLERRCEPLGLTVAPLEDGVPSSTHPHVAIVTETQLFGERVSQRRRRSRRATRDSEAMVRDLSELHVGAPVVHELHGIGRYRGLETITAGGMSERVPGPSSTPTVIKPLRAGGLAAPGLALHRRGARARAAAQARAAQQWQKARQKAAQRAFDVAAELLDIQARRHGPHRQRLRHRGAVSCDCSSRASRSRRRPTRTPPSPPCSTIMRSAAGRWIAWSAGTSDSARRRWRCAPRSSPCKAGWQVAVLVPTTLLAQQHHQTFADRFADWPVRVESLSRFRSRARSATRWSSELEPTGASTSSSARTSCCRATCASSVWAW